MKYTKYIAIAATALSLTIGMSSCADALDVAPDGSLTMDEIIQDPVKVSALMATCYKYIPQKGYAYNNYEPLPVSLSDDAWSSDDGTASVPVNSIYNDRQSAQSHPLRDAGSARNGSSTGIGAYWSRYWGQIYQCNLFLSIADKASFTSEEERSRNIAEAHLLRAFFYSELVRWFGKLPVIDKVTSFEDDFSGLRRQPVKEVVDFIIKDCDAAIACKELPWRITLSSEAKRVTKALAWAIKSRMSLTAASPLFNEGNDYWEWAYQINKDALAQLKANGYELLMATTNPTVFGNGDGAAFRQICSTNADIKTTPVDKETIYQDKITFETSGAHWIWHIGYVGAGYNNTAHCKACPTQELVDAFETTDGQPVLDLDKPYLDEKHLQPNYNADNTLYDPQNPYINRDPRLHETALCNGDLFTWDSKKQTLNSYIGGKSQPSLDPSNRTNSRTSYYHCKTVQPNIDGGSGNKYGEMLNWKFYRLAEIYLNLAEAAAEAGHLAEAAEAANAVRARVKMPALPALAKEKLISRIRNERRVEMAWEETRYFDLRRWQKPDGNLKETCAWLTGMRITKQEDGTFKYERYNISNNPRGGCSNRDLLLPLSVDEANRLEGTTGEKWQNPGW